MNKLTWILIGIIVVLLVNLLIAYLLMLLWNSVIVSIFSLPIISFWQSLGLILILSIISLFFNRSK